MSFTDWLRDYLNSFYNKVICWMIKHTYLRATTIWAIMRRMDEQVSNREMEHYINEYKKWKEKDFKQGLTINPYCDIIGLSKEGRDDKNDSVHEFYIL